jgi:hypothetical protein
VSRSAFVCVAVLLIGLAGRVSTAEAVPVTAYTAALMSTPGRGYFEVSFGGDPINGAGLVAGSLVVGGVHHAAVYNTRNGHAYELNGLRAGCESEAVDVNVHGHVAGYQECSPPSYQVGFFWSSPSEPVRYVDSSPMTFSRPSAMNDHDVVVGSDSIGGAYSWSASTGKIVFMTARDGDGINPYAVNNGGYATGVLTRHYQQLPFLWIPKKNKAISLDIPSNWPGASAEAINDSGYIVLREIYSDYDRAFVWSPITHKLNELPSDGRSVFPAAINAGGVVVGSLGDVDREALVWDTCEGSYRVLPAPANSEEEIPNGINIYGRIVGVSVVPDPQVLRIAVGTSWDAPAAEQKAVKLPCRS